MANTLTLKLRSCKKKRRRRRKEKDKKHTVRFCYFVLFLKKGSDARDNNITVEQEQLE